MNRSSKPGVVRIIGGRWKRTPLTVVAASGLRPTPDRVRKTVFDWLNHALERSFDDLTMLDLFAGSGALGLEAASRGAKRVVLVERDRTAAMQLRAIVERLDAADQVVVREGRAETVIREAHDAGEQFDVVFLDPPFAETSVTRIVEDVLPLCRNLLYVESAHALDRALTDALGLTMRRSAQAGAVFYHLLQRKNNEEIVDASSDLSGNVRPAHART